MKGIQQIFDSKKLVAIVFKASAGSEGTDFITSPGSPLQIGLHKASEKRTTSSHKHGSFKPDRKIERHEVVLVQNGCVKITFYSDNGSRITQKKLLTGDGVLIMDVKHQLILMPGTKIIEIKQGPYVPEK